MRLGPHWLDWHGERYTVEPIKSLSRVTVPPPVWAVSHRGEFIGTISYRSEETTKEFEQRCAEWLQDLLET